MEPSVSSLVDDASARAAAASSRASLRPVRTDSGRFVERPRSVDMSAEQVSAQQVIPRDRSELACRAMNIILALIGMILVLPIGLLVAILIKLTSRGPIMYAQTRVGRDRRWRETLALYDRRVGNLGGQVFTMYKFRTMRVDAELGSGAIWAVENDPRVTLPGKYLRKLRIDELPQLWNILLGDMNLVGPRPERPSIVARLREDIPEYQYRHRVRPGLTGLAQINQKYDSNLDDVRSKVNWDLRYLKEQSLWLDIKIMLKTVPAVLLKVQGW
jgi:lipopolysaccharide/colanic/teichoic acid biosynthesis glycosyltransferase